MPLQCSRDQRMTHQHCYQQTLTQCSRSERPVRGASREARDVVGHTVYLETGLSIGLSIDRHRTVRYLDNQVQHLLLNLACLALSDP